MRPAPFCNTKVDPVSVSLIVKVVDDGIDATKYSWSMIMLPKPLPENTIGIPTYSESVLNPSLTSTVIKLPVDEVLTTCT